MAWDDLALAHVTTGDLAPAATQNAVLDNIAVLKTEVSDLGIVQRAQSFRGLSLRTSPDADLAQSSVALLGLDEIVLSDGARYTPSTFPLTASTSALGNGAGFIDVGGVTLSKWYEIYVIGKSTTKAASDLALILHRAPEYSIDQTFTTDDTSEKLRQGATDRVKLAQGFKGATSPIHYVDVKLTAVGTPALGGGTPEIHFTIETDSAGSPSGSVQATSDTISATAISTSAQTVRFVFRTPFTPASAATQYHLVLQGNYTASAVNYVQWQGAAAGGYANGSGKKFDGTSWAAATPGDFWFKTGILTTNGSLTFPADYDESCKIGYVYNDSGNHLVPFIARDRWVRQGYQLLLSGVSETISTLRDVTSVIPPGRISVDVAESGSVSGDLIEVDGVPDGVLHGPGRQFLTTGPSSAALVNAVAITTEYQGLYAYRFSGTGTFSLFVTGYRW
jgi:hypothetical protein